MSCSNALQSLIDRNINNSKPVPVDLRAGTSGFELEQPDITVSCNQTTDPFATFCTIPQPSDDPLGVMCNLNQQTQHANSYFQRVIRGHVASPNEMAPIWESAHLDNSNEPWFTIPDSTLYTPGTQPNNHLGLKLYNVTGLAVSDDVRALIAVREGMLYQSYPDGLIHPVYLSDNIIQGANTHNQNVTVSPFGAVRAALFFDTFFFYGNDTWQPNLSLTLGTVTYQSMKMWQTKTKTVRVAIFYTKNGQWFVAIFEFFDSRNNSITAFTQPIAVIESPADQTPFSMGFLTIQTDNKYLFWSTLETNSSNEPRTMQIHMCSTDDFTDVYYNAWTIQSALPLVHQDDGIYTSALSCGAIDVLDAGQVMTLLFVLGTNMYQTQLSFEHNVRAFKVITRGVRALALSESLDHTRRMFALDDKLRISCDLQTLDILGQTFVIDDANIIDAYVFALTPTTGTDVWLIRNNKLYRLNNTNPSPLVWGTYWQSSFPMYFAVGIRVSDFGLPTLDKDVYVPAVDSRWYMGTVTTAQDANIGGSRTLPFEVARSAHQTFRYMVTQVGTKSGNLKTFPFAIGTLQRANEYVLSQLTTSVTVANDSNVVIGSDAVWQSNTHDQISIQDGKAQVSNLRSEPFAISSNNGLYVLYKIPERNRLRLIFNPYNAHRMTQWCEHDGDRFNQALQNQHDFCWNSLKLPDTDRFADSRCTCIGGAPLFAIVAPGAQFMPRTLTGPLAEALPCFTNTCTGGKNGDHETPTNVLRFVGDRCNDRIFNICQGVQQITDADLTNNDFVVLRNCGIDRSPCTENGDCDPGNLCYNGRCTVSCKTDKECQAMYGLSHSSCVSGMCSQVVPPPSIHVGWWVYVTSAILLVLIILVLVYVALTSRPAK